MTFGQLLDKLTSTVATEYTQFLEAQTSYADTGNDDTYVVTTGNSLVALKTGMTFNVLCTTANTGSCTLNVDGLGATGIKVNSKDGLRNPLDGEIVAGGYSIFKYDGTYFQLLNPNNVQTIVVDVALTSANIKAMNGAPVTLIAAVTGKTIVIDEVALVMTTTATGYANGGAVELRYTDGSGAKVTADIAGAVITAGAGVSYTINKSIVTSLTGVISSPIVITNASAPFITGTGTGILTIRYHLV